MRGHLLIFTFGMAILFHISTSSRLRTKNSSPSVKSDRFRNIRQIADRIGATNYEEFSASIADSDEISPVLESSEYFSTRKQRASGTSTLNATPSNTDNAEQSKSAEFENYQGVSGRPGFDFPVLTHIPRTKFSCRNLKTGYYADLDTDCQVFHICDNGRKISFLCPNGTIFRQSDLICDWWFKVDCNRSPTLYEETADQFAVDQQRRKNARRVESEVVPNINENVNSEEATRQTLNRHSQTQNRNNKSYQQNIKQNNNNNNNYNNNQRKFNGNQQYYGNEKQENLQVNEQNYNRRLNGRQQQFISANQKIVENENSQNLQNNVQFNQQKTPSNLNFRNSQTLFNSSEIFHHNKQQFNVSIPQLNVTETTHFTNNAHSSRQRNNNVAKTAITNNNEQRIVDKNPLHQQQQQQQSFNSRPIINDNRNSRAGSSFISTNSASRENDKFDSQPAQNINIQRFNNFNGRIFDNVSNSSQETQLPAETASFASNKFNNFERFYKQNSYTQRNHTGVRNGNNYKYTTDFIKHDVFNSNDHKENNKGASFSNNLGTTIVSDEFRTTKLSPNIISSTTSRPLNRVNTNRVYTVRSTTESSLPIVSAYTTNPQPYQISNSYSTVKQTPEPTVSSFTQNMRVVTPSYIQPQTSTVRPETTTINTENATNIHVKGHFVTYTYAANNYNTRELEKSTTTQNPITTVSRANLNAVRDAFQETRSFLPRSQNEKNNENLGDIFAFRVGKSSIDDNKQYKVDPTTDKNSALLYNSQSTLSSIYLPPKIESRYSKVSQTPSTPIPSTTASSYIYNQPLNEPYFYPRTEKKFDPTIFSLEDTITTQKVPKFPQSVTKYSPTVPTVTPKTPTQSTIGRTDSISFTESTNFITTPTPRISENAMRMIYTLENLEGKLDTRQGKLSKEEPVNKEMFARPPRPGLRVPPSSSPDTLHSLAMYFALAVDDDVIRNVTLTRAKDDTETTSFDTSTDDTQTEHSDHETSLLTQSIMDQYKQLFNTDMSDSSAHTDVGVRATSLEIEDKINKELSNNDLESQQSRGPVSKEGSNGTSIRQLARVFTHALSEYLKDPDMFKRVLSEIRPTEPPEYVTGVYPTTEFSTTLYTEHPSITKEEDEVLDFSDVVKTTSRRADFYTTTPYTPSSTATNEKTTTASYESSTSTAFAIFNRIQETNTRSLINPLAARLNEELGGSGLIVNFSESSESEKTLDDSHENNYFPLRKKSNNQNTTTSSPYGQGVKPNNSVPLNIDNYKNSNIRPAHPFISEIQTTTQSILRLRPSTNLTPPKFDDQTTRNDIDKISADVINYFVPEDLNNLAVVRVNEEIISQQQLLQGGRKNTNQTKNEEQLQVAYSQSFVSRNNNNLLRNPKTIPITKNTLKNGSPFTISTHQPVTFTQSDTTVSLANTGTTTTESYKLAFSTESPKEESTTAESTTFTDEISTTPYPEGFSTMSTTSQTFFDVFFSQGKTTDRSFESTTVDKNSIPSNHWTRSPAVTQLLQSSIGVDAVTINRELGDVKSRFGSDFSGDSSTESSTTSTEDVRFLSDTTTELPFERTSTESSTDSSKLFTTTEQYKSTTDISTPSYFISSRTEPSTVSYVTTTTEPNIFTATTTTTEPNVFTTTTTTTTTTTEQNSPVYISTTTRMPITSTDFSSFARSTTTEINSNDIPSTTTIIGDINNSVTTTDSNAFARLSTTATINTESTSSQDTIVLPETIELAETKSRFGSRTAHSAKPSQSEPQQFSIPFPDYLNSTEIQIKSAKEIFGGLNSTSQNILMSKMKHADSNKSVRRLVLLLINTCDLDHNKTLEEARNAILNALLNTPVEENDIVNDYKTDVSFENRFGNIGNSSDQKKEISTTDNPSSITTTTTDNPSSTPTNSISTTVSFDETSTATTIFSPTTSVYGNKEIKKIISEKVESYRQSKSIETKSKTNQHSDTAEKYDSHQLVKTETDSDARALELLQSLYSLAAKWGKK